MKKHKYIFVIGGVMSGVGKGISTASLGTILESMGYRVNLTKVDPYLNVDAGTMNPTEHGEVFVMSSGLETDQDMGNYERFLNRTLTNSDYMTSGMVYLDVISKERNLKFGGRCVEAIPDVRDAIIDRYEKAAKDNNSDISIIEIGGTLGDYQNELFMQAARTLKLRKPNDVIFVLVSYLPIPSKLGEMKTRPTQNAIRQLNSYGINADFIVARAEVSIDKKRKEKIALNCNISPDHVISAPDIESIYDVPLNFEKDKIGELVSNALKLKSSKPKLDKWRDFVYKSKNTKSSVKIGIVGKYFDSGEFTLSDSYISVIEAIKYSGYAEGVKPEITWLNSKEFEKNPNKVKDLKKYDGIIVPGGFGETGVEGKINVIKYCRENKIPYFGLCYGMQLLVIEYARNVAKIEDAHTREIKPKAKNLVIDIMEDQKEKLARDNYGGSMRLGSYKCELKEGSIAYDAYKSKLIEERHRHRYEVNPDYIQDLEKAGLVFSGKSPNGMLMEIAEIDKKKHPFMLGTQFHPEFLARPLSPHPLFSAFIRVCKK